VLGYSLPDEAIGYGVPMMKKVRPMRPQFAPWARQ
jgi:hypothetical protein